MGATMTDQWKNDTGDLVLWAAFRCHCGQLSAMADQTDGNAAMVHTSPRCAEFEALQDQAAAVEYFRRLPSLQITPELVAEFARRCRPPD